MSSRRGALLTFEGIDGSGKSTQAELLVEHLRVEGADPLLVREPGGTELSEEVRALLLKPDLRIDPFAELLLFSAARAQLCRERIQPALERGRIVVCDRFYDSTTAYQGAGRQLHDLDWLEDFHRRVTDGLVPDRTYLIELSPEEAKARRQSRPTGGEKPDEVDRMEAAEGGFYQRVAAAYARLADAHPHRILRLDGAEPVEVLHDQIQADVEALLQRLHGTPISGDGSSD